MKKKTATEKRNHIPTDTYSYTHIGHRLERTNNSLENKLFYRKIEQKQWNTISNDKWHKILQVTVTDEKRTKREKREKKIECETCTTYKARKNVCIIHFGIYGVV